MLARMFTPREVRAQATPWGDWAGGSDPVWSGANVDERTAIRLLTCYGCGAKIANGIASLPVATLRDNPDGQPQPAPRPRWVDQPMLDYDPGISWIAFVNMILDSLFYAGHAYYRAVRDSTGAILELVPLDPGLCTPKLEDGRRRVYVNGTYNSSWEIHEIPAYIRPGDLKGMSPLEAARQSIGLGLATEEYGARFFGENAMPGGVLEIPGENPTLARELLRDWNRRHRGKAHNTAALYGGAKWTATSVTNEQAQFLETRNFTAAMICANLFHLDPTEMGIAQSGSSITYANLAQRNTRLAQVTYRPWIEKLEWSITALTPSTSYIRIDTEDMQRGDPKTQMEIAAIGIANHVLVPNEPRKWLGLPPLPGGDVVTAVSTVDIPKGGPNA